jgi:hypothetical protein
VSNVVISKQQTHTVGFLRGTLLGNPGKACEVKHLFQEAAQAFSVLRTLWANLFEGVTH